MVRTNSRADLEYLCDCLGVIEGLSSEEATEALAAFLKVGLEGPAPVSLHLAERAVEFPHLLDATNAFVLDDAEGGKRGQALVAACLSLVFEDVHTRRINDPGRRWPGDVAVGRGKAMNLAAEVKQRPVDVHESLQFADRCRKKGCRRALMVMLDPTQPELPEDALHREAWDRHGVHLTFVGGVRQIMSSALSWTLMPFEEALSKFPRLMLERLQELEVSQEGVLAWAALFQGKK